ncbi:WXG100 family type VII secretion target [Nocardia transvalensis]|uniref:WXG100 family type VII secretion target n=1 Tax=Nocardia transvalensis TaxID=37333 RepID=UPI0018938018|nr:WXG100 family type VII secretion target [Nocardia transvalensis]MBF6327478.1 WXG100 family type VII secretion target [Nocardia transvalensis]
MSVKEYNLAVITPGLQQLRSELGGLTAANNDVESSAKNLLAIWTGAAADGFNNAHIAWKQEFSDTLAMLQKLIDVSDQAVADAIALDASLGQSF